MKNDNIRETIINNVNNTIANHENGIFVIENIIDFYDFKYSIDVKKGDDEYIYFPIVEIESLEYNVKIVDNTASAECTYFGDDAAEDITDYIECMYEDFMQYVTDMRANIANDVDRDIKIIGAEGMDEAYFDNIQTNYVDDIDDYDFEFVTDADKSFKAMWYETFLECVDQMKATR